MCVCTHAHAHARREKKKYISITYMSLTSLDITPKHSFNNLFFYLRTPEQALNQRTPITLNVKIDAAPVAQIVKPKP